MECGHIKLKVVRLVCLHGLYFLTVFTGIPKNLVADFDIQRPNKKDVKIELIMISRAILHNAEAGDLSIWIFAHPVFRSYFLQTYIQNENVNMIKKIKIEHLFCFSQVNLPACLQLRSSLILKEPGPIASDFFKLFVILVSEERSYFLITPGEFYGWKTVWKIFMKMWLVMVPVNHN